MAYSNAYPDRQLAGWLLPPDPPSLELSVVVPIYNEEANIPLLYTRLTEVLAADLSRYGGSYEIILVDDGSTDNSYQAAAALSASDERVRVIQFRRNFGKTAALHAGFRLSCGAKIVTIDADMQEDPGDMPLLLDKLDAGNDLVSAWRKQRHDSLDKKLPSFVFNTVVAAITRVPLHDFNCGFKAYTRDVITDLDLYGEQHRFIPVLARQRGFRIGEVPVTHRPRRFGKSKFGAGRLINGYLDFIQVLFLTTYLRRPLRLFGTIGTLFFAAGLLVSLYMTFLRFQGEKIGDRPLLILGVLLLITGLQFLSTGLVGEMLRYDTRRARDDYAVWRVLPADRPGEHNR
jgi:glycosyltransferase involved in cell wall biosynthesis